MLKVELDEDAGIAILEPIDELSENDFVSVGKIIDPYLEEHGDLKGLIIRVESFPGWDSFSSLVAHLKFVKDHHKKIARIAFVTDSAVGNMAEKVAGHFVSAEIKHFDFDAFPDSRVWIIEAR